MAKAIDDFYRFAQPPRIPYRSRRHKQGDSGNWTPAKYAGAERRFSLPAWLRPGAAIEVCACGHAKAEPVCQFSPVCTAGLGTSRHIPGNKKFLTDRLLAPGLGTCRHL